MIKIIIIIILLLLLITLKYHCKDNFDNYKNNINFLTFGAGGEKYYSAGKRLITQANELNLFDKTKFYSENDFKKTKFYKKHKQFIEKNKRGYGYWLWKPYIIKETFNKMKDGDILLYLDCGCELGKNKKNNLKKLMNDVKKYEIIYTRTYHQEKKYNKMDLIEYLNMNNSKYLNSIQIQAGVLLILVNTKTRKLINEWYNIGCNYHFIDDSKSVLKNDKIFKQHRHDQSIFSLLIKKYNLTNNKNLNDGVYVLRNKNGKSKIKD
tara:strand:+ start:7909 stop:8703 length:795 start_codon:yes stop_codon:yes gene_type:complete